jgi:hypothetical protein
MERKKQDKFIEEEGRPAENRRSYVQQGVFN